VGQGGWIYNAEALGECDPANNTVRAVIAVLQVQ